MRILRLVPVAVALAGCGGVVLSAEARAANDIALTVNASRAPLVAQYQAEGEAAIHAAPSREAAEAQLNTVRARWLGVWGRCGGDPLACRDGAWPALHDVDDAWAALLERKLRGEPITPAEELAALASLRSGYCALQQALPAGAHVPAVTGLVCTGGTR